MFQRVDLVVPNVNNQKMFGKESLDSKLDKVKLAKQQVL